MANYNHVVLVGNLTRDVELRHTASGVQVAEVGLAVNDRYKQNEHTNFFDLTIFGRQAEIMSEYCSKGSPVLVEGKLKQERWEASDGQKRSKVVVIVNSFQMLGSRGGGNGNGGGQYSSRRDEPAGGGDYDDIPF